MTERSPLLGTLDGNELRRLRGEDAQDKIPLWLDDRPWIRVPASFVHTIWTTFSSGSKVARLFDRLRWLFGGSFFNALLVFLPLAIVSNTQGWSDSSIFALNLIVLLPLENLLNSVAENIVLPLGEAAGELLSLIMPHVFPILIMMVAILRGEIHIVQPFVVGSILTNILLGLGGSFVAAGLRYMESSFSETATLTEGSVLYIIAVPFAIVNLIPSLFQMSSGLETQLQVSREFSIIMIVIYFTYQLFKIKTHRVFWDLEMGDDSSDDGEGEDIPGPKPTLLILRGVFLVTILFSTWYCTKSLVDAVAGVVASTSNTRYFIGLVLLPLVTNTSHYFKTYRIAYAQKVDIAISLTLANNAHLALFDLPFIVLYSWCAGIPVTLDLGISSTTLMIVCVIVSVRLIVAGKSNFLTGAMYLALYIIMMFGFYLFPDGNR